MPVDTPRPEYSRALVKWQTCRDAYDGEASIKARGPSYLPPLPGVPTSLNLPSPPPSGLTDPGLMPEARSQGVLVENQYQNYQTRALYYNATKRTVQGLTGAAFRPPLGGAPQRGPGRSTQPCRSNPIRRK